MSRMHPFKLRRLPAAVLSALLAGSCGNILAGPTGGQVVGGSGSINQSGATTTINQSTQNMAINWQSYNVNVDERVQYIQPNSSAISLNRILSNNGSTIAGRIDANGQVILVNPNGIFFTPTSVVNVGGIIASGLDIAPTDFMNGNYIFNEVLGTDGTVINSGTINASLGGNVALIGKQVENNGLIVANLGTVSLAAGKQAVLTFDNGGLLGVRVSEEILQDELGVDPAVMNSGEIQAQGGQVLLSASTSQDVFSQAVNSAGIEQATSVVVHEDGSFTLGGGADVVNSGRIDTSSAAAEQAAGRIVLLGENVTSSGELRADAASGNGGEIELHAQDTTLLTGDSLTSARAESDGKGGTVKVLGERVGLFDQSTVDVSGAEGGGQVLIGGDYQGNNSSVRNASRTTIAPAASIHADALEQGDGGQVIVWADEYTRYYGNITARGGEAGGNGGFAEVSGKASLAFWGASDLSASAGLAGTLLLDPKDIRIVTAGDDDNLLRIVGFGEQGSDEPATLSATSIVTSLAGGDVRLQANNDITFEVGINSSASNELMLQAGRSIILNDGVEIVLGRGNFTATINDPGASASERDPGLAEFLMHANSSIITNGGSININTGNFRYTPGEDLALNIGDFTLQTLNSSAPASTNIAGGAINITNSHGNIIANGEITAVGGTSSGPNNAGTGGPATLTAANGSITVTENGSINTSGGNSVNNNRDGGNAGAITIEAEGIILNGDLVAIGGSGPSGNNDGNGGRGGDITITATAQDVLIGGVVSSNGGAGPGDDGDGGRGGDIAITAAAQDVLIDGVVSANGGAGPGDDGDGGNAGNITLSAASIDIGGAITANGGNRTGGGGNGDGGTINVNISNELTLAAAISSRRGQGGGASGTNGDITFSGDNNANTFNINPGASVAGDDIRFNGAGGADTFNIDTDLAAVNVSGDIQFNGGAGNDIFNIDAQISFLINGQGGNDIFHVNADILAGGVLNGGNGADTFNISANIFGSANGENGSDTFNVLTTDPITANLVGGDGGGGSPVDTVVGPDGRDNTWLVSGAGAGTLNNGTDTGISFSGMEVLTGGNNVNTFTVNTDASIATLNGGTGADMFNISGDITTLNGDAGDDTINVNGGTVTTLSGVAGANFITVNSGTVTTLNGGADNDTITVNGGSVATINGNSGSDTITIAASGSVDDINAGAGDDTINVAGTVSGVINGGADTDTLTITRNGNQTVHISTTVVADANFSVAGFETIEANNGAAVNTLRGDNGNNTWTVDGDNSGNINETITFEHFANLVGGSGEDRFEMGLSGVIASIDGGAGGVNTLVARQGVANIWNFTTTTSGSLAQDNTDPVPDETYVGNFSNIQNFAGGGGGNEWANFALAGPQTLNAQSFIGFVGIIGNENLTLAGADGQTNTWEISDLSSVTLPSTPPAGELDGANDGVINRNQSDQLYFIDFANLLGGDQTDNFVIDATGSITGSINGGGGANNSLTGRNVATEWHITNANTGAVYVDNNAVDFGTAYVASFSNIQAIQGGSGNDTFVFSLNPIASQMSINGGEGNDNANLSGLDTVNVQLGDTGFSNVELIIGNNTDSTLTGTNTGDTWQVTAVNTGNVTGMAFEGFNHLVGGSGDDNFSVQSGGSVDSISAGNGVNEITVNGTVVGAITSGTGIDTVNVSGSAGSISTGGSGDAIIVSGTVNGLIDGGTGTDSLIITAGGDRTIELGNRVNANTNVFQVENIAANTATRNELIGDSDATTNTWALNGPRNGTVNDGTVATTFSNIDDVTGSSNTDNFTLAGDFAGLIDGGLGTDSLTITAAGDRTIELGNRVNANLNIYRVETLMANAATRNELIGDNAAATNTWSLNGLRNGTVSDGTVTTTFSNIDDVTGSSNTDNFTLTGNFAGLIDGGLGTDSLIITVGGDRTIELGNRVNANTNVYRLESITANSGTNNELVADSTETVSNTWTISGANSGIVTSGGFTTAFSNIQNLTGTAAADSFTISGVATSGVSGVIDGMDGPGVDSLTITAAGDRVVELGDRTNGNLNVYRVENITALSASTNELVADSNAAVNTWSVTGNRSGSVSDGANSTSFSNFNILTGGSTVDRYTVNAQGAVTAINSGEGNDDVLIASNAVVGSVDLGAGDDVFLITGGQVTGAVNGGDGSDSITVSGGSVGSIAMGAGNDFFVITGGTVTGNVNGNDGNDTFTRSGGIINGSMTGDAGTDFIVYAGAVDITLGVDIDGFEGVTAQNNMGVLRARAGQDTTWNITGDNAGDVADSSENLAFVGFSTLIGNSGVDTFNVFGNGSISGLISGNDGDDTLNINLAGRTQALGTINYDGGGSSGDAVVISGPAGVYNEAYSVNQTVAGLPGSYDRLSYTSSAANLDVNFRAVASVTDNLQVNTLTINSTNALNTIRLGTDTFGATNGAGVPIGYAPNSKGNVTVLAQNGADVIIEGDVTLPGTLAVTADALTQNAGTMLTADTLFLDGVNSAGTVSERLNTTISNLQVNSSGPVYVNETDGLNITQLNAANLLDIQAGGDVTSDTALVSSGVLNIATAGNVQLNSANTFSGTLNISGDTIDLVNTDATNLASVNAQNLTINSTGDITDSGSISVSGAANLTSAGAITLDTETNDFGTVDISASQVTLRDVNNIAGGNISAGEITLTTATGVGASVSPLRTSTAELTINNSTGGGVFVENDRDLQVSITNMGDILLQNNGSVIVERLYTNGGNYNSNSSQYIGDVTLRTNGYIASAYMGEGAHDQFTAPDIVAENLEINTLPADLGLVSRPISIRVNDRFTFVGTRGYVYYFGARPREVIGATDLVEFSGIMGMSGQQLIEIESLGDVDEAVFTEVRNYYHEDVAIMLPADQRMTDDEDEEERKRREAVN